MEKIKKLLLVVSPRGPRTGEDCWLDLLLIFLSWVAKLICTIVAFGRFSLEGLVNEVTSRCGFNPLIPWLLPAHFFTTLSLPSMDLIAFGISLQQVLWLRCCTSFKVIFIQGLLHVHTGVWMNWIMWTARKIQWSCHLLIEDVHFHF